MSETSPKGRRVTIDLTAAAAREVDKLKASTGLTTADLFRHALSLLRLYVEARAENRQVHLVDPTRGSAAIRVELPIPTGSE